MQATPLLDSRRGHESVMDARSRDRRLSAEPIQFWIINMAMRLALCKHKLVAGSAVVRLEL
jgi:hypothetical protein